MKQYRVFIDITVTKTFSISAESEEQAKEEALRQCRERSDYYARDNDGVVDVSVSECEEDAEPEEENAKKPALDYVRSQLDEWRLEEYRAAINSAYEYHTTPTAYADFDHIRDLLEEYGQENDLTEGWWENEGDLDDWLYEL